MDHNITRPTYYEKHVVGHEQRRIDSWITLHEDIASILREAAFWEERCDLCNRYRSAYYEKEKQLAVREQEVRQGKETVANWVPWEKLPREPATWQRGQRIPTWMYERETQRAVEEDLRKAEADVRQLMDELSKLGFQLAQCEGGLFV